VTRHPEWDETVQGFARQLSAQVAADRVGGVEAGIVVDGELVWHQAFGWSSRDEGTPLVPGGAFRTASISRTVTAILLLRLVDRGVVALDDPVQPYLPELAEARNGPSHLPRVTFRHLASHTSGLARNYQEGLAGPQEDWQERVAASFGNLVFDTVPGSRYQDSPIGFGALGLALERAAGRPFMELARTEVFQPLGMSASSFSPTGHEIARRLTPPHPNRMDGEPVEANSARQFGGEGYVLPSGGLISTVEDLGRLLGAIAGAPEHGILPDSLRRELTRAQTPGGLDPAGHTLIRKIAGSPLGGTPPGGLRPATFLDAAGNPVRSPEVLDPPQSFGLALQPDPAGSVILHAGGVFGGYGAYMAVDPETRIGVVLLRNYLRGRTDLRAGAVGLVTQLGDLARGRRSWVETLAPPMLLLAGALLAGFLLHRLLGSPKVQTRIHP
jgi:CubicO group peptidase (beta-lactamase class C family)